MAETNGKRPPIIEHISKFAKLTPEEIRRLENCVLEREFRKGDKITGAVNFLSYAYYIHSGSTRLFYTSKGKETTIDFIFEGGFVLLPKIVLEHYSDTVTLEFLEPTKVMYVPVFEVKDVVNSGDSTRSNAAVYFLLASLIHYTHHLEERLHLLVHLNSYEKLEWVKQRYPRLFECATITQIASFIGVTKETLYRIRSGKYSQPKRVAGEAFHNFMQKENTSDEQTD